ncbi:DNA mismatch repair protein [Nocardia sp. NPDC005366]|uniref:MutS-related protein n=1 Tax=Nocardia sp. NPDC005366 TaxID=3156878 RepID=UPI0033A18D03
MIPVGLLRPPRRDARIARNGAAMADDLGLEQLYSAMAGDDDFIGSVVRAVVRDSLTDIEVIRYRQDVLADCCADPAMPRALYAIATEATSVRRWIGRGREPRAKLGLALQPLEALVHHLRELRRTCAKYAASCTSDGLVRLREVLADQLDDGYLAMLEQHLAALYFDNGMIFSAGIGAGNKADRIILHEPPRSAERTLLRRRSGTEFEAPSDFEHNNDPLRDVIEPPLESVAEVISNATDNVQDFFRRLRTELAFYLGCLNLRERLTRTGTPVCFPVLAPEGGVTLRCRDLRDAALSLTATDVVGNDIDAAGATLVVVTGANSGGKSTFLRSVGTAQLMMQAGMFVTAEAFTADVRDGVFTHFVRGEDPGMKHGRLDEELARMREITDRIRPGAMLLCNEPFASTNDREAAAVAEPIVSALLDSGVKIVLVTHLFELTSQRYAAGSESDLFLRVERASDGRRTYRVRTGAPAPTSHGGDIFAEIFGSRPEAP